jgi:hypothetical protein
MSQSDFRELLTKVQGKFSEYGLEYPQIQQAISYYFLQAGQNWEIPESELNFIFVLGMNLEKQKQFELKEGEK